MKEIKKYSPAELDSILELYNRANFEYYRSGDSIMSDMEFDNLRSVLEFNGYDFTFDDAEPTELEHNEKLTGTSGMGSLSKVQVFSETMETEHLNQIANYLRQSNPNIKKDTPILVGWKLDGNAIKILWNLKTGKIEDIITRGNFSIYKKFIDIASSQIKFSGDRETRCEAVMSKLLFANKYLELGYANPRNLVAGILNDENIEDSRKSDVIFVPLNNGINPSLSESELDYYEIPLFELPKLFQEFKKSRSEYDYPTDGMVVYLKDVTELQMKGKYPLHSIAIKFPPVKVNAVIKDIEWNLKKSGSYIPKIILEPVELDGTIQRRVAAFNYNYIMENKLFPGAVIEIGKNGDIIAYVQRVIVPGDIANLKSLPADSKVVDIHLMADGAEAQKIADTEKFIVGCYTLGLKNFGYAWFKNLSVLCNNDIIELFNPNTINIDTLNNAFGGSKKQIEFMDKLSKLKLNTYNLILMLQFPRCGHSISLQVAKYLDNLEYDFVSLQKDLVESLTSTNPGTYYHDVVEAKNKLSEYGYTIEKMKSDTHVYDATFEMTGSPKPLFETKNNFIASVPNWKHTSLKKGTTYLVTDSPDSNTGKMKKARSLGIEILSYEQAYELYTNSN